MSRVSLKAHLAKQGRKAFLIGKKIIIPFGAKVESNLKNIWRVRNERAIRKSEMVSRELA